MGGAASITMLLGMVRIKFAAILIGTTGVGLLASFTAIQSLVSTIAGLGIQSSAVREIAAAVSKADEAAIGRAVLTLRRICWLTGLSGMLVLMALSPVLSQHTFGSDIYTLDIAALGLVIFFNNLSGGQLALIQGMRRIGDMARANILGSAFATLSAISFYTWLELRGIVPALVSIAVMQLALSWHFARRVPVPIVTLSWRETFQEANSVVRLGLVFMWNGLMVSAVGYITVMLITQQISLHAVGLYSAAFALSGMLVNFVLNAMSTDYYPRLIGVAHDKHMLNRLANEQTEIGLLLAVPGLLATLVLAPWIIRIFYSSEFLPADTLLQWFILGCLGRVFSWPLGFIMLALGKGRWFFATETSFNMIHIALIALGLMLFGIKGVAIAFFTMYIGYTLAVYWVAHYLTGFNYSNSLQKLIWLFSPIFMVIFITKLLFPLWLTTLLGVLVTFLASIYSLRELVQRVGAKHRIARMISKIPGSRIITGSHW